MRRITPSDDSNPSPVTLINPFEVPKDREVEFIVHWKRAADFLQTQSGFISNRLLRTKDEGARFRFTNIAVWESRDHFWRAIRSRHFREILGDIDLPHYPALYELLLETSGPPLGHAIAS